MRVSLTQQCHEGIEVLPHCCTKDRLWELMKDLNI